MQIPFLQIAIKVANYSVSTDGNDNNQPADKQFKRLLISAVAA